jgi:MerR family mercuric resistance operon transcriptional regulator
MNMTISQVARLAGVGVETVRFYEREGLLPQPTRPETGYRQYSLDTVSRIQFIKRAKELGFSLKEIAELLALCEAEDATCADVKQRALSKIVDVERKVEDLTHMKGALMKVVDLCTGSGPLSDCPILDALDDTHSPETDLPSRKEQASDATETSH